MMLIDVYDDDKVVVVANEDDSGDDGDDDDNGDNDDGNDNDNFLHTYCSSKANSCCKYRQVTAVNKLFALVQRKDFGMLIVRAEL